MRQVRTSVCKRMEEGNVVIRRLTFELSGRQRQDASARTVKMYRVPPDRAWWPAVGAPLERVVRRRFAGRATFVRHEKTKQR